MHLFMYLKNYIFRDRKKWNSGAKGCRRWVEWGGMEACCLMGTEFLVLQNAKSSEN